MTSPADMTVDELHMLVARALPAEAAFDGWNEAAVAAAAARAGVPAERLPLLFPGGAAEMVDWWTRSADADMAADVAAHGIDGLKIRARIRLAIWSRLERAAPHREAVRRALAVLARPANTVLAARILWRTTDAMWRAAGDRSVDVSHYTRRMTLGGVYSSTLLVWLNDQSEGFADTAAFLDRRLADVMRIEKAKASLREANRRRPKLVRFLGRLRYPAA